MLTLDRMNRIHEIDARDLVAVVEAGVDTPTCRTRSRRGLFYPPDPSSRESAIGGNIARTPVDRAASSTA